MSETSPDPDRWRWELVVHQDDRADRRVPLTTGSPVVVGRGADCGLRVDHSGVSREHCRLEPTPEGVRVADLDSTNGTWLDGERIQEEVVRPGQEISLGPVTVEVRERAREKEGREGTGGGGDTRVAMAREDVQETVSRRVVETGVIAPEETGEEPEEASSRLWLAYRVSRALAQSTELDDVFDEVIDVVFEATTAERVALLAPPPDDEEEEERDLVVWAAASKGGGDDEITVSRTVVDDVVENGVSILSRDASEDSRYEAAESVVAGGIRSVACAPLNSDEGVLGAIYADSRSVVGALSEDDLELLSLIGNEAGVALRRQQLVAEREQSFLDAVRAVVATVDAKDGYTHRHSERVAATAARLAREAGWDVEDESLILLAGLVHDVGKIGVPDAILNKEGSLTDEEYGRMQHHAAHGDEILAQTESDRFQAVRPGVRHHHEKWDGTGYPDGLAGEDIPRLGRVLAVADVLDALTSNRSYRDPMPMEKALGIVVEDAGQHFDPEIARAAESLYERDELAPSSEEVDEFLRGRSSRRKQGGSTSSDAAPADG